MALLQVTGLSKSFGGILALSDVSLSLEPGESVGVVGPNGAGKTTFFDCIAGRVRPDTGTILFEGREIGRLTASKRSRLGIASTFQRLEVFTGMTPLEHVLVTERVREGTGRLWRDLLGLGLPTAAERRVADELIELVGLSRVATVPVEALTLGQARLTELARALASAPRLLLLDEPSSGLDANERAALAKAVGRVRAQRETAVLLIEHDLGFVKEMTGRLVVLDSGRVLADGMIDAVLSNPAVRHAYLGPAR